EVIGATVALLERRQPPARLDELEDGDRLVLGVVDEPLLRTRRDDARWDSEPRPPAVDDRRGNVIPSSAMFIVGDDDHDMGPDGAILYGLDQPGHLLLAGGERRVSRVFIVVADRFHKRDGREAARGQITEEIHLVLEVVPCGRAGRVLGEVGEGLVVDLEQLGRPAGYGVLPATRVPGPRYAALAQPVADRRPRTR